MMRVVRRGGLTGVMGKAMRNAFKDLIKRLLQVPRQPLPPAGANPSMQLFRAAPGFLRYRLLAWSVSQVGALIGIVASVIVMRSVAPYFWKTFLILEGLAVAFFLAQLSVSFLMIVLDYEYRWYMVTDRSLRIREGLLKIQERTMTFSNIQNVSIRQGPLQRLFGISDVEVRTAGGGDSKPGGKHQQGLADNLHLGYFRGVDNAAEIRDTILAHLKRLRSSGLGDPDEPAVSEAEQLATTRSDTATASELLEAGQSVLAEARALRQVAGSRASV